MCVRRLTLTALAAVVACGFAAQAAAADENRPAFYVGVAIEDFHLSLEGVNDAGLRYQLDTRPLAVTIKGGWNPFDWLGVEAFFSTGIHEDPNSGEFDVFHADDFRNGGTELKSAYGLALKPRYTLQFGKGDTTIDLYAIAGYSFYEYSGKMHSSQGQAKDTVNGPVPVSTNPPGPEFNADFTLDDSSVYYGAGIQLVGQPAALTLQWVRYADEDNYTIGAWQIGVIKFF